MSRRKPRRARQSMSALDTLAEVSRHHPDILDRIQTSVNHDQQQDTPNNNLRQDDEVMIDHCLVQGEKRPREDEFEVSESGIPFRNIVLQNISLNTMIIKVLSSTLMSANCRHHQSYPVTQSMHLLPFSSQA